MCERDVRARESALRREVAGWQTIAVCVLVVAVIITVGLGGASILWEKKYRAAVQIEQDAIAAYADLTARVEAEQSARAKAEAAFAGLEGYEYMGTFFISHYCCEDYDHNCNDGDTITATGLQVQPGVVAVDPDVIPLGSTVIINGTSYLAADAGVSGSWIDVAVPTHAEAEDLGIYTANVWVVEE